MKKCSHHDGAYYKISTGITGTRRYNYVMVGYDKVMQEISQIRIAKIRMKK